MPRKSGPCAGCSQLPSPIFCGATKQWQPPSTENWPVCGGPYRICYYSWPVVLCGVVMSQLKKLIANSGVVQEEEEVGTRNKPEKKKFGEYHHLVQELCCDEEKFTQYFRLSPAQFRDVLQLVEKDIRKLVSLPTTGNPYHPRRG